MKARWATLGVLLVAVVLLAASSASAGTSSSLFSPRYKVGEPVLFKVETESTCWWCCSSCGQPACPAVTISGWRVADSAGRVIYTVVHDALVASSTWQGSWSQVDSAGAAVAAGYYTLYVDTSVGTLSLCVRITDPCGCCGWQWGCTSCGCDDNHTITNCNCKTSLVLVPVESPCGCGQDLFGWLPFGNCGCASSSNCSCASSSNCGCASSSPCTHCP